MAIKASFFISLDFRERRVEGEGMKDGGPFSNWTPFYNLFSKLPLLL